VTTLDRQHHAPATSPAHAWRERLYAALRGRATPLLVFDDRIIPAASVWTGAREWTRALRSAGLSPGDRVVLSLEPSPAFLMALTACLWEGLSTALAPPTTDADALCRSLDARATITPAGQWAFVPDHDGGPTLPVALRQAQAAGTPDVRLLLRTSGTTGPGRWVALSDANVLSVIDAHGPALALAGATTLSVLPWHHAFGLVIDLLPALLCGANVVRDGAGGRDPARIVDLCTRWGVTSLSMVPLTAERLCDLPDGRALLGTLRGGIVGGAAISARLATVLAGTNLRVGYGLTEAAPGVCVGRRGEFSPGFIGRPLRCQVRASVDGVLEVRGENVCMGTWGDDGLRREPEGRWLNTGDVVERVHGPDGVDGYRFLGRVDDSFKLANGRFVDASRLERSVLASLPWAEQAVVRSPDGHALEVVIVGNAAATESLTRAVRTALGGLGERLREVRLLAPSAAPRTSKGSIDRRRLAA
jgi:acyl-CoA synthetase (AMP-forming)/AMP-acid ligase II